MAVGVRPRRVQAAGEAGLPLPAARVSLPRRSPEMMKFCRTAKAYNKVERDNEQLKGEKKRLADSITDVLIAFPGVARAMRLERPKRAKAPNTEESQEMDPKRAESLTNAVFMPVLPRGLGVKGERLIVFAVQLAVNDQDRGRMMFLAKCAYFRALSTVEVRNLVCLGYAHQADSTLQQLAQQGLQSVGRATKAKINTEVLHQGCVFKCFLMQVDSDDNVISEVWAEDVWQTHSTVLFARTSPFILQALLWGCLSA